MADADKKKAEKPATAAAEAPAKKKPPIKVIAIVGALMAAEAAGVYFFVGMTGGQAKTAEAHVEGAEHAATQETVEIPLVDDKFQNMQTGNVWVWDMAIVLKVKSKHEGAISEALEKRKAEINEGISQIIRRAQHSQLREPDLTTVNRQVLAYLETVIKPDEATGHSRIDRVLIPKCKGLQID
jgi:flagellar basal body-associated protein FliL